MITQKPWFGARRFGYGWTPITAEGWFTLTTAVACEIAVMVALPEAAKAPAALLVAAVLCAVCWLTSGPPGHKAAPVRGRTVQERKRIYRNTHPDDPSIADAVGRLDAPHDPQASGPPPELR